MIRDFEKQFPLPFEYDSERNIIKDKNGKMMMLMTFATMTLKQIEHCDALGTYLVACANLMPEAVELIKYLREKMLEDASWVQFDGEEKIYACDEELKRIDNFLAKLGDVAGRK